MLKFRRANVHEMCYSSKVIRMLPRLERLDATPCRPMQVRAEELSLDRLRELGLQPDEEKEKKEGEDEVGADPNSVHSSPEEQAEQPQKAADNVPDLLDQPIPI